MDGNSSGNKSGIQKPGKRFGFIPKPKSSIKYSAKGLKERPLTPERDQAGSKQNNIDEHKHNSSHNATDNSLKASKPIAQNTQQVKNLSATETSLQPKAAGGSVSKLNSEQSNSTKHSTNGSSTATGELKKPKSIFQRPTSFRSLFSNRKSYGDRQTGPVVNGESIEPSFSIDKLAGDLSPTKPDLSIKPESTGGSHVKPAHNGRGHLKKFTSTFGLKSKSATGQSGQGSQSTASGIKKSQSMGLPQSKANASADKSSRNSPDKNTGEVPKNSKGPGPLFFKPSEGKRSSGGFGFSKLSVRKSKSENIASVTASLSKADSVDVIDRSKGCNSTGPNKHGGDCLINGENEGNLSSSPQTHSINSSVPSISTVPSVDSPVADKGLPGCSYDKADGSGSHHGGCADSLVETRSFGGSSEINHLSPVSADTPGEGAENTIIVPQSTLREFEETTTFLRDSLTQLQRVLLESEKEKLYMEKALRERDTEIASLKMLLVESNSSRRRAVSDSIFDSDDHAVISSCN